jgi:hypothetical protein
MPFKKFLPYILIALILAAAAFFIFHRTDDPKSAEQKSDSVNLKSEIINQKSSPASPSTNSFTDPDFGFSFKYPLDVKLGRFEEGD